MTRSLAWFVEWKHSFKADTFIQVSVYFFPRLYFIKPQKLNSVLLFSRWLGRLFIRRWRRWRFRDEVDASVYLLQVAEADRQNLSSECGGGRRRHGIGQKGENYDGSVRRLVQTNLYFKAWESDKERDRPTGRQTHRLIHRQKHRPTQRQTR